MIESRKPKITAVDIHEAQLSLPDLIRRSSAGEEVITTEHGKPVSMLASPGNIQIMSNVGAIYYELPFDMGRYGWMGPDDYEAAKIKADDAYRKQFGD